VSLSSTATFAILTLSCSGGNAGTYEVTVAGTGGTATSSTTVTYLVQDFQMFASPTSVSVNSGTTATSTISVTPLEGFVGTVTLGITTNSTSLSCNLSSTIVTGSLGTSTLSCAGSVGNYLATVTGTSSSLLHSETIVYHVSTIMSDFTISAGATSVIIDAGVTGKSMITVVPVNGFTGTLTLSFIVSPSAGLTCALSTTTIVLGPSQNSTLSCAGMAGLYNVTATGTIGTVSHSTTVTYTVQDFIINASPLDLRGYTGTILNSTIVVSPLSGFSNMVTLAETVSPNGDLACTLGTVSITRGSGSSLSCVSSRSGFFTVTVTGTDGSLAHSIVLNYAYSYASFLLDVQAPSPGVVVTIDGTAWKTNASGWVSVWVESGTHTILVQSIIPFSLPIGVTQTFHAWGNGVTDNPLTVNVDRDTVLTATYNTSVQTSFYALAVGLFGSGFATSFAILRRRKQKIPSTDL
jgi:hypothetical protein